MARRESRGANPDMTAALSGNTITFTTRYSGPVVNTYPSVYTAAGTAAGTFGGLTLPARTTHPIALAVHGAREQ